MIPLHVFVCVRMSRMVLTVLLLLLSLCTTHAKPQAKATDDSVFASEAAYVSGVEKAYALTGVGEDDYESEGQDGALSREKIEAELARRNVWRDVGEVGCFMKVGFGDLGLGGYGGLGWGWY